MRKLFLTAAASLLPLFAMANWSVTFDENTSVLTAKNNGVAVEGKLSFASNGKNWKIANSRDAVKNRMAIVDHTGDVQGYIVFPRNTDRLEMLFYHRTAQAYRGFMNFDGTVKTNGESFACRSKAAQDERVLALNLNNADSALNDSVFTPDSDTLLQMTAARLGVKTLSDKAFAVKMSGDIGESSQSKFIFDLQKNYFKNSYVPYYKPLNRKNCPKTPTGWMSWNTYFDKATAEDNLAEARIGQKFLQPFGCEIWSIESWQGNSDKLPVSKFYNMNLERNMKQFPEGMKKLAQDIRALGFRPGLWVAPYGTGNAEFYNAHKDWFIHDKDGKPVKSWNGVYTLDPSVPEALEHLKNIFRTASKDWGYEFFKIDGMSGRNKGYCAHLYERPEIRAQFKNPKCENPFELTVKAFREGIGEDRIFLACQGHTSGPEAGYAEMARTGADIVHPNKPVMWKNVTLQGRCTINQIFTHNISMIADPDTLLVKDLPLEEARTSATIVALPGQLTFFGDKLAGLDAAQMKMLQQTLPVALVKPMNLYPYFNMLPIFNLAVNGKVLGNFNVVAFINWDDDDKEISVTPEELGISPDNKYVGFEFWTQKYLGEMKKPFAVKVPAHGTRLVVLSPMRTTPQYLGSDRHIACAAEELKSLNWDSSSKTLSGEIALVKDFPLSFWVSIPKGFDFDSIKADGAKCEAEEDGNALKVTLVKSPENKGDTASFKIKF